MLAQHSDQKIKLIILSKAGYGISLFYTFLNEKIYICTIALVGFAIFKLLSHFTADISVLIKYLYLDTLTVKDSCQEPSSTASTYYHYPFNLAGILLYKIVAKVFYILSPADKIGIIHRLQAIISMRNYHLMSSEKHCCQYLSWHIQIPEGNICQL